MSTRSPKGADEAEVGGGAEEDPRGGRRGRRRTTSTRTSRGSLTRQAVDEGKVVLRLVFQQVLR
jgi:hypothetical protein